MKLTYETNSVVFQLFCMTLSIDVKDERGLNIKVSHEYLEEERKSNAIL